MEKFQELREQAKKKITIADHMLTQTYPLVRDVKLLLTVLENVFLALSYSMSSVLYYDRLFKKISAFPENFEGRFYVFKDKCVPRYNIDKEYLALIREIKEIIIAHKKSPVEFVRNDRFIICSENYRMKTVNVDQLKKYIAKSKVFVQETSNIVNKNAAIFR